MSLPGSGRSLVARLAGLRFDIALLPFVLGFAVLNSLLFQWPVFAHAWANVDVGSGNGWLTLAVLLVLMLGLMTIVLLLVSVLSLRLMKALCVLLLLGNALALYFMHSFGAVLDREMMGNVFNTRSSEALELLHPNLLLYLLLGLVPALAVLAARIRAPGRLRRALALLASTVLLLASVYAGSSTWLWFDKHIKIIGGLALPWNYLVNTIRFQEQAMAERRPQQPLPALDFSPVDPGRKTVVVLVVGEAARPRNFSLYGYARPTNPQLSRLDLAVMPGARACASYTTGALRCMLSHLGSDAPLRVNHEPLPSYLHRHGVDVVWRTNNWGETPIRVDEYLSAKELAAACGSDCDEARFDGILLHGLRERIASSPAQRVFVVLHQTGSHGPSYASKYPSRFEAFTPVCRSVELQHCDGQSLTNAYDNTILYTDDFLARTIAMLGSLPQADSTMMYMSDHGESLGEQGFYLHGAPAAVAPDVQMEIPFLVWMSPEFARGHGLDARTLARQPGYTQDAIFHSVLGAFGGRSPGYRPQFDIYAAAVATRPQTGSTP